MKFVATIAAMPLLLWAAMAAPLARAQDGHQHPAPDPAAAPTMPIQRWDTDVPLRIGMGKIRTVVDALQHYEHGHIKPGHVVLLATQIQGHVAYLVANCKLEPQADAALHVIIVALGSGAQALKDDPTNSSAIASMRQALQRYPRQFNDPGWTSVHPPAQAR